MMNAVATISSAPGFPKLPEDVDLEQAVIGALIMWPDRIAEIEPFCSSDDFFHHPHPKLVEAIFLLARESRPVTPLTIQGEVGGDIGLPVQTYDYLAGLAEGAAAHDMIAAARKLADLSRRRRAMIAMMDAQERLASRTDQIANILQPVVEIADQAAYAAGTRSYVPVTEAVECLLSRAQAALDGKTIPAVTTGLAKLDHVLGGLQAGDLAVYAGRPGMGKSAMLMTTAVAAVRHGRPALVFSLEMSQERLLERVGCDLDYDAHPFDPLSYQWFRKGSARADQVQRIALAVRQIPDHLKIFDRGDLTIHEIAAMARAEASRSMIMGVVVIDYLQKVRATDRYRGNKVQEITEISGAAKALAMRIGWPVVVGAQLNRGVENREDKMPTLSDLRESGAIEQDADQVIGLYREGYYVGKRRPAAGNIDPRWAEWQAEYEPVKNKLDLIVLKNRHGEDGAVSVHCDMRASAIRDEGPR